MTSPITLASEATKKEWLTQQEFSNLLSAISEHDRAAAQPADDRQNVNSSALRGLVFGVPLAIALWTGPILAAGLSRNWWLGAAVGAAEVGAVALLARVGRRMKRN